MISLLLLLVACSGPKEGDPVDTGTSDDTDSGDTELEFVCAPPTLASGCDNTSSIVRGQVSLGDITPTATSGDLLLVMTHRTFGQGAKGGVYRTHVKLDNVDLAAGPVPFELDMCDGGAMWSEDNCGYNLLVTLDTNNNATSTSPMPDPLEAATRHEFEISCRDDGPCLDVVLDCTAGASCLAFADGETCECGEDCSSVYYGCG